MPTVIDLTHPLTPDMPVYPGTEPPLIQPANTIEGSGYGETLIRMYSHTGTHIDAPSHMLAGAPSLDQLAIDQYVGRACAVDVSAAGAGVVGAATLEANASLVAGCDFVLHVASPFPPGAPRHEDELIIPAREGALRVLRAARGAGVKRVVLTSSFAVFMNV